MSFGEIQYTQILKGRYIAMAAQTVSGKSGFRCYSAAACSSAQMIPILDAAVVLAVSICVLVRILLLNSM